MKLSRHNARSGKHGTFNPKHNDRKFDLENSEHIDAIRTKENIYWDCYQGFRFHENDEKANEGFEKIEKMYYASAYGNYVFGQNERNAKSRHFERNRTTDDIWANEKTCPEESVLQIGNIDGSASRDELLQIAVKFISELQEKYGDNIHILDWALHMDEATPHVHERHVFDCENRYGEKYPQQEKVLEKLGFELPFPDKKKGRNNNRKMTYDAECRNRLLEICKEHRVQVDEVSVSGNHEHLEKQDFIIENQKKRIAEKEKELELVTLKLQDVETLVDEIADDAYEKACETVSKTVRETTRTEDKKAVTDLKDWYNSSDRKLPKEKIEQSVKVLTKIETKLDKLAGIIIEKVKAVLQNPIVKEKNKAEIKERARISVKEKMAQAKIEQARLEQERKNTELPREQKKNIGMDL